MHCNLEMKLKIQNLFRHGSLYIGELLKHIAHTKLKFSIDRT